MGNEADYVAPWPPISSGVYGVAAFEVEEPVYIPAAFADVVNGWAGVCFLRWDSSHQQRLSGLAGFPRSARAMAVASVSEISAFLPSIWSFYRQGQAARSYRFHLIGQKTKA